ncbi:chymotrypsin-1-like [Lycorma delicatula]|uniref:chymotrypsin-1-like n=1 Tax=Lycorma delicatula TaxID=130591 RepID=UPI003F513D0F
MVQLSENFDLNTPHSGGLRATPGEFPYVALSVHTDIKCTAVVISDEYILGAAHCYWTNRRPVRSADVIIITGLTNINQLHNGYTQKRTAENIIINPNFKERKLGRYDVALVKLMMPLLFDLYTSPIPMDNRPFPVGKEIPCTAIGWGDIEKNVEATNLVKLNVNAEHSKEACHGLTKQQYSSLICVTEPSSGRGLCDGDSGGPLICDNHLVGIAHQVYKELEDNDSELDLECGMKGLVHTFMFICKHLNWIQNYVKDAPNQPTECYRHIQNNPSTSKKSNNNMTEYQRKDVSLLAPNIEEPYRKKYFSTAAKGKQER